MKIITLAVIAATTITTSVFAQGTVNMGAFVPTNIGAQTNTAASPLFGGTGVGGISGATAVAANSFYYELLYTTAGASQPASLAALGGWTDSTIYALNSSSAGRLTAGNGTSGSTVNGMLVGTAYSTMLVGWSANLGTTWATAYATLNNATALGNVIGSAYFGMTTVGSVTPTSTSAPGQTLFGTSPLIFSPSTQLYLVPVPEPATIALAGLGGLALLALRRKK